MNVYCLYNKNKHSLEVRHPVHVYIASECRQNGIFECESFHFMCMMYGN